MRGEEREGEVSRQRIAASRPNLTSLSIAPGRPLPTGLPSCARMVRRASRNDKPPTKTPESCYYASGATMRE